MPTDTWTVAPYNHPLDVDWPNEGDEWFKHVKDELQRLEPRTGWNAGFRPGSSPLGAYFELKPNGPTLSTTLRLVPQFGGGLWVMIVDVNEANESEVETWKQVVSTATDRIGTGHATYQWSAMLGPETGHGYNAPTIDETTTVGPVSLHPAKSTLWEHREVNLVRSAFECWPVIAAGSTRGYEWDVAMHEARSQLHRAAALISLAAGNLWVTKFGPGNAEPGWWKLPPPYEEGSTSSAMFAGNRRSLDNLEWLNTAWGKLANDPTLRNAALMHYEGLRLARDHPSFAVVAHVSAVETVGQVLGAKGSRGRFREGLSLLRDRQLAQDLDDAYGARSGTAHGGILHAGEDAGGTPLHTVMFGDQTPIVFQIFTLRLLRYASREAVTAALGEGAPTLDFPY